MTIFRIVGMLSDRRTVTRYVRAESYQNARVRAFKAFDLRTAALGIASRQMMLADVGTRGYDEACNASETFAGTSAALRAQQSRAGNDLRTFYNPKSASAVRTSNKAKELMVSLGLA